MNIYDPKYIQLRMLQAKANELARHTGWRYGCDETKMNEAQEQRAAVIKEIELLRAA